MGKLDADNFISGNHKIVRNVNRSAVLNLVRERQPVSRAALSTLSNLNKSTVLSIVRELLEEKLIYETRNGESTWWQEKPDKLIAIHTQSLSTKLQLLRKFEAEFFLN
ncbi:hypothetical protein IH824_08860 [candidate division KSB1 bacterium]|nr:hypothetical protein [candidate division KSB1 bacterium]